MQMHFEFGDTDESPDIEDRCPELMHSGLEPNIVIDADVEEVRDRLMSFAETAMKLVKE